MAFLKKKETPEGTTGEYHKINEIGGDLVNGRVVVGIKGYLNQKARKEGKSALSRGDISIFHTREYPEQAIQRFSRAGLQSGYIQHLQRDIEYRNAGGLMVRFKLVLHRSD